MRSQRRHKAHEEEHENHERWLITYADMITLLMAFFIMMYSLSVVDLAKFKKFQAGAQYALGKGKGVEGMPDRGGAPTDTPPPKTDPVQPVAVPVRVTRAQAGALVGDLQRRLAAAGLAGSVTLKVDQRGVVVYLTDRLAFPSGQADLSGGGAAVLRQLGPVLQGVTNPIVVEGHTDNVPTDGSAYATNWELSTFRATTVLRHLSATLGIPATRLSAAGYADTRPRAANSSPAGRALNRRVEIVVVVPGT